MKRFETDVLIIGGGGAATAAAISAHSNGARTMLAVKGRFGVPGARGAGATSNPLGDFWTMRTVGPEGSFFNPPSLVYRDMLQTGLGMADPQLCRIFVDEVGTAISRLNEMGLQFKRKVLAVMEANPNSGGTNSIVSLQKAVIEGTQTRVLEQANIVDIVVDGDRCVGAIGIGDDGDLLLIEAGAVILAAGGVGQLFRYSFNPSGNTGDAYAMALRAGAALFNMEFMQQGLATTWPTQAMVMLYEMKEPYRLLNGEGKTFVSDYLPEGVTIEEVSKKKAYHWPVSCRDEALHLDRAIKGEVLAGRGTRHDGVFLDLSRAARGFEPELFQKFMLSKGIDVDRDLLQVQVHHHTSNGGIRIDADAQSNIAGLFAAGEAAGWQGADRLGGTMLSGSQVFGWRAGSKASQVASSRPSTGVPPEAIETVTEQVARFSETKGDRRPLELRRELQRIMWETLIVEKDAGTLTRARDYMTKAREDLSKHLRIAEPADLALAFEQRNLLDVAEVIVAAACMRTESRGSHYRRDYPKRDDVHWLTNIFITKHNGTLSLQKEWVGREHGWKDEPGDVRIKPWG
ncbi:MAG TPA: FAD-binding protein [Terriglobales bacterium]|nr:FAD-binding protein [Terriglobales bacterium]